MTTNPFEGSKPTLRTGLPQEDLKPDVVYYRTRVLLAQAETLGRLHRAAEQERKLLWTFAVAYDCFALHPDSLLAVITAARVARIAGQFDLADKMLRVARKLNLGLQANEWVILGIILADRPVDRGFLGVGGLLDFGMLRDGQIGEAAAASVGWIFIRRIASASDGARRVWRSERSDCAA
jgi:hypothetical protein